MKITYLKTENSHENTTTYLKLEHSYTNRSGHYLSKKGPQV